jgi:hypothetical protein
MTGSSLLPLSTLAGTIKAHIAAGDKAVGKAEEHYKAAGIHLLEAKERVKRTANLTWPAFLVSQCSIQRSRADELISIAEGRKTLDEVRSGNRERDGRRRERQSSAVAHGKSSEKTQEKQSTPLVEDGQGEIERLKEQLAVAQAEVDRLTEENEALRANSLHLDDHAADIAEKLIEMEDQKKLSKIAKLINDHLKHPERTQFQRSAAIGRGGLEHADGRRYTKADLAQLHCWRVEGVDTAGQRWGNGVKLATEEEAKLYADHLAREENVTTNIIRVPGEPALNAITMNDDGSVSIGFMHGMCGSLEWKPLPSSQAA